MIRDERIQKITQEILEKAFYDYFQKAKKQTKHIVLDRLFPRERRITSTMAGLQTSLGSFWENLAKKLAVENSFQIVSNSDMVRPSSEPDELTKIIESTIHTRQTTRGTNLGECKRRLNEQYNDQLQEDMDFIPMLDGKGCDIILKKNEKVYIFDLKTVQVNSGNGHTFNDTLIRWLAYYKFKYRINARNIHVGFVFPYNSTDENDDEQWWQEYGARISPLTNDDVYVGNDFWKLITDNQQALANIIAAIDELSNDEDFIELYRGVFDCVDENQLKQFIIRVKIKRAEKLKNISLITEGEINTRRKLRWRHEECIFSSTLGTILKNSSFVCPVCEQPLP